MSQVIQFLEAAGSSARLSAADYAASVAMLQVSTDQRQALLNGDHLALNALLDGRANMCCQISVPDGIELG